MGPAGLEPATYGLKVRSSTIELEAQGYGENAREKPAPKSRSFCLSALCRCGGGFIMPDGTLNRVWGAGGHGRAPGGLCGGRRFGVVADAVPRFVASGSPGRSPLTPAVLDPDTVEAVLRALTETEHAELLIRRHPRSPNRRLNWSNSTDPTTDHRPADTVTSSHRRAGTGPKT